MVADTVLEHYFDQFAVIADWMRAGFSSKKKIITWPHREPRQSRAAVLISRVG